MAEKKKKDRKSANSPATLIDIIEKESLTAKSQFNSTASEGEQVSLEQRATTSILEIGDLAIGTKVFNPDILKGLGYFLESNGYDKKIKQVIIAGGLKPAIPLFWSVRYGDLMRFLGNDPERNDYGEVGRVIEECKDLVDELKKYAEKYWKGKVSTPKEAEDMVQRYMTEFFNKLPGARIDYYHGDEDKLNMRMAEEMERQRMHEQRKAEAEAQKEKISQMKGTLDDLVSSNTELEREKLYHAQLKTVLSGISVGLQGLNDDSQKKDYIMKWLKTPANRSTIPHGEKGNVEDMLNLTHHTVDEVQAQMAEQIVEIDKRLMEIDAEAVANTDAMNKGQAEIADLEARKASLERPLEKLAHLTGQYSTAPGEEEFIFKMVKDAYNGRLYDLFQGLNFHVHTSSKADVELDSGVSTKAKIAGEDVGKAGQIYEMDGEFSAHEVECGGQKLLIAVMHNMNRSSNSAGLNDIELIALENSYLEKMAANYKSKMGKVPDIFITQHGAGGLRVKALPKKRDEVSEVGSTERAPIPEICMAVKIPGLEDLVKLQIMRDKGLKTPSTIRQSKKLNASGATIHTVLEDGSHVIEYVDSSYLAEIGESLTQLEGMDKKSEEYKTLKQSLDSKVLLSKQTIRKSLIAGDLHVGAGNLPDKPSNYEYLEMMKNYVLLNYVWTQNDRAALSEVINGDLPNIQSHYSEWGDTPAAFEQKLQKTLDERMAAMDDLSVNKQNKGLKELVHDIAKEAIDAYRTRPIASISLQMDEAVARLKQIFTDVLGAGGELVFVSGNHPNKIPGYDEAKELRRAVLGLQEQYKDQVRIVEGQSSGLGGSGVIKDKDGKKTYFCHVPPRGGKDSVVSSMKKALGTANDAGQFVLYHVHQGECGYADGTAYTIPPGLQNALYPDVAGYFSTIPGFMMHYGLVGENTGVYHAWHFVLGNTLLKHYPENIANVGSSKPN